MRVLIVTHPQLVPNDRRPGAERDVWHALKRLGHQTVTVGVGDDFRVIDKHVQEFRPQIVFNLLEEFRDEAVYDFHLLSYLESRGLPFTGCNPRGLILSRNKLLVGQVASANGVAVPQTLLLSAPLLRKKSLNYPLFLKFNREHSSLGIRDSNRVRNLRELRSTWARLRQKFSGEILLQEFVAGREMSVSLLGNSKVRAFAPRVLHLGGENEIATEKLKFNLTYQKSRRLRVTTMTEADSLLKLCRALYARLDLSGYARFDFRVRQGRPYLIDVNANPSLAKNEDFAGSLHTAGCEYTAAIEEILKLGRRYRPRV